MSGADGVLGRTRSLEEIKSMRDRLSTTSFELFAYENDKAPLGKVFHSGLNGAMCWDAARNLARDAFKKAVDEIGGETEGKHIVGKGFWIYRYEFTVPRSTIWATEALARILSGDFCDQVEEIEVCCIWYEQMPDGQKYACESPIGQHDKSPKMKKIGRYGNLTTG